MEQASMIGWENVLKIHNMDVVNDPLSVVTSMCEFFEVRCSQNYVQSFVDKVFKKCLENQRAGCLASESKEDVRNESTQKI